MEFRLFEDGYEYCTYGCGTIEEALTEAESNVDTANYDMGGGTIFVSIQVVCDDTDESASATVALDPDEPECSGGEHDWQSPHHILGGLEENPGVFGHGGGVIIEEVCMHCGCARITDTWAQNPDTGEQGLRSVEYSEGKYADEIAEVEE
jgi:hypothetical protein